MASASPGASIIISVSLMLIIGFGATKITKLLKLPNVTAYILVGILIGPFALDLIPQKIIGGMDFLSDIALAFIAFSTGEFLKFSTLKKSGIKILIITLFEALTASVVIFVLTYFILDLGIAFSIVLSALASATAPASTIMTIRQTGAKGEFVDTLLQVIAIDNLLSILAYSVSISIALSALDMAPGTSNFETIALPILTNIGVMLLGGFFGFVLKWLMPNKRYSDNRLIIAISVLFAFCGICTLIDVSPLLGCMSMGMIYINFTNDDKLFKQLAYFSPPILLLFFVRSGLNFNLSALFDSSGSVGSYSLIVIALLYFVVRIVGKYGGAFIGSLITKKPPGVRNYLGMALIPQAGVAIGLAALCARTLEGTVGNYLQTIILASSILYEIVGPACAKLSLHLSGSYSTNLEELTNVDELNEQGQPKTQVQLLIERIGAIQQTLPQHENLYSEEENAFTQAAEDQYAPPANYLRHRGFINRRF
ncbi:MAG: cation:proton antiporter [Oscillospiraceae bacterium]|nr:cation:proton antiporter [Oscillospiraceae bacterium]MBQ3049960.1 cation:proton antiporter [Oscillospiraceae bacterium]